jgi:hypothetical protein
VPCCGVRIVAREPGPVTRDTSAVFLMTSDAAVDRVVEACRILMGRLSRPTCPEQTRQSFGGSC